MPKSREKIKSSLLIFHQYQFEKDQKSDKKKNKSKEKQKSKVQNKKQIIDLKNTSRNSFKKAVNKFKELFQQKIEKKANDLSSTLIIKQDSNIKLTSQKQPKINYKTQKPQNQKSENKFKGTTKGLTELFNQMQKKLQNYKKKFNRNKEQNSNKQAKNSNYQDKRKTGLVKSKTIKQLQKQKQVFSSKHYLPHKASKAFSLKEQKANNAKSLYSIKKNKNFISYSLLNSSNKKNNQSKLIIKGKKSFNDYLKKNNPSKSKSKQKITTKSKQKITSKSTERLKKKRVMTDTDLKKQKFNFISHHQFQQQTQNNSKLYAYLIQQKQNDLIQQKKEQKREICYKNQDNDFESIIQFIPKKLQFQNEVLKDKQLHIGQQNNQSNQKQHTQIHQMLKTLQKYFKTFCQLTNYHLKYQNNTHKEFKQSQYSNKKQQRNSLQNTFQVYDANTKNSFLKEMISNLKLTPTKSIKIETQPNSGDQYFFKMMKQQQENWLKLKEDLDNLKQAQNKTQFLQSLIKEVDKNHALLQNIKIQSISPQITKQKAFIKNKYQKQDQFIKLKKYQEAPINVKWLMNKPSSQDSYKESQRLSMELSQKKLLEDIDLMNFISNNRSSRSLLFQSNSKSDYIQGQIDVQIQEPKSIKNQQSSQKYNKQKSQSQQLLISGFSQEKKQKIEYYQQPQHCLKKFKVDQQFEKSQTSLSNLNLKQSFTGFQQQSIQANKTQQKLGKCKQYQLQCQIKSLQKTLIKQNSQKNCNQQQSHQKTSQNISQQNSNDSHNKIVEAFNKKKKQILSSLIFQSFMNQFAIDIVKSNKLTYFVVDSFNKNVVQIHKYEQSEQPQYQNAQILFKQQDGFSQLKIKSDKQYIQLYVKQILQYSLQDQDVKKRLNIPIGIKPLQCIKYMRYLERQTDEDEEEFVVSNEEYQNIISLQNIYGFENVFDSQMNNNQQEFNQSICDAINNLLDNFRPFGKKGWPPICFNFKQNKLQSSEMKSIVLKQVKNILQIKLGIINFNVQPWEIQKILKQSLTKFSKSCAEQFQEQLVKLQEIAFQIQFQLMNQIQNDIFLLICWELSQFMKQKQKLFF